MKNLLTAVCFACLATTAFGQDASRAAKSTASPTPSASPSGSAGGQIHKSDIRGLLPASADSEPGSDESLPDRVRKLEKLVNALQHENDLLKKKLQEERSGE